MYSVSKHNNQAHVIVCGNEKGGSGKTTTIMHITIALLNAGYRVATIDLDTRQQSFTRYIKNRKQFARRHNLDLSLPDHFVVERDNSDYVSDQHHNELNSLLEVITKVQSKHDFVVIDTPGHDGYLMRMAHSMADTLITPMNDSYVDFDVLGNIDSETGRVNELSHYAKTVRTARRQRRIADNGLLDWIVVRNRLTHIHSRNKERISKSLNSLSMQLGCRLADGISERVVFRELFPKGLTVLDDLNEFLPDIHGQSSHNSARQEVQNLITTLKLPTDELSRKRSKAREKWLDRDSTSTDTIGM